MNILIAEDTWHTAMALRRTIERAGGTISGMAGHLDEAELMARAGCDAVVMDLNLNGHMAHDLAGRLAHQGFKVVVLSGYRRPANLDPKIHAFLEKPTPPAQLIAALTSPIRP